MAETAKVASPPAVERPQHARRGGVRASRYREIAEALTADIQSGRYPLGTLLPTETEFCERFKASRHTVREALRILTAQGFVSRRSGAGSTVIATSQPMILVPSAETVEPVLNYPAAVSRHNIGAVFIEADSETAQLLQCPIGAPWYRISEVRHASQAANPIGAFDVYLLPKYASVTAHKTYLQMPIHLQVEQIFGRRLGQAEISILAARIPPELAGVLNAEAGSPALRMIRRFFDTEGELFEIASAVFPEGRYAYTLSFRRDLAR
jgi:DNA-binding GntR family transcriptional regulator